ncbi:MAG TPA: SLBB domain-containing protein [Pyrinomonadaceae bacterium]|nr:SLBB domain-containing protein [Pyrinomonadaceae bacterium]
MKAKTYLFLFVALCLVSLQPVTAQDGGQAAVVPASSIDDQGIVKYLLGPGDTLDIRVFGQPDLNWVGEVDPDGNISSLPFVTTPIVAQCRTEKEVQKDIIAAYTKMLKDPQISVRVTGRNSRQPAVVLGAVLAPARVEMKRRVRLNELIAASGGLTDRANGDIQVLHTEPVRCPEPGEVVEPLYVGEALNPSTIKMFKVADLLAGKTEANPVIRPGDIVNVMEAKPVYVTGQVVSPQPILLREGMTLLKAVAMVGGLRPDAKSSDVRLYRTKPGAVEPELVKVDLDAIRKRKEKDIPLQAYDIVEVAKEGDFTLKGITRMLLGGATSTITSFSTAPGRAFANRVIY